MRRVLLLGLAAVFLTACGRAPVRPKAVPELSRISGPARAELQHEQAKPELQPLADLNACAPTRIHHDSDYTAGGLYLPGVADSGPEQAIDISGIAEPVPRDEPRLPYGNRTPYRVLGRNYRVLDNAEGYVERGVASWYGSKFNGRATSSGELYDICSFTAAHKTLPLPTYLRVTNLDNGRSVIVRVNDRGPFHEGRLIDLSYAAAVRLGVDRTGTARVELRALSGEGDAIASSSARVVDAPIASPSLPRGDESASDRKLLQMGSFAEKANAKRLADRLEEAGFDDVDVDHVEVAGRDLWRVLIGPMRADKSRRVIARLRDLHFPSPRVLNP